MLLGFRLMMLLLGLGIGALGVAGIVALVRRRWSHGFWLGVGTACGGFVGLIVCAVLSTMIWRQAVEEALARPYDSKVLTFIDTMSNVKGYVEVAFLSMAVGIVIGFAAAIGRWRERRRSYEVDQ